MKKIIHTFIFLFIVTNICYSQRKFSVDTTKYSINLPDYWKFGNKIWQILSDKLPLVCEELKDKELCGDHCNPKYSIEFEMSDPVITNYYYNHISSGATTQTWQFVTTYSFGSSLLLFNEKDELITRFVLVDKNETWRVMHNAELQSYLPAVQQKNYLQGYYSYLSAQQFRQPTAGQTPFAYINDNTEKLWPTRRNMLSIVDEKIKSW